MIVCLGWSLLHFLWQGTLVALLLAACRPALRQASAQARYLAGCVALLAMLAWPLATFAWLWAHSLPRDAALTTAVVGPGAWPEPALLAITRASGLASASDTERGLTVLVGLWGLGVMVLGLRTLGAWVLLARLRRMERTAVPATLLAALARLRARLEVSTPVRLYQSASVQVPTVLGWLRPMILLPVRVVSALSQEQLEAILAHELAHVRRHDYLVNLAQAVVETLLFYHPAVWWVSGGLRLEREHCCDDLAVACEGGNALRYARALVELEALRPDGSPLVLAATGGDLAARIRRLLGVPVEPGASGRTPALGLAGVALIAVFTAAALRAGNAPVFSATQATTAAAPEAPAMPALPATPTIAFTREQVITLARAGVTPEYVAELTALGYAGLEVEQLVTLRAHGIEPDEIRALTQAGYRNLKVEELVALRQQGVSADYVAELRQQGLADLSLSDLLALRRQGVDGDYVASLARVGYRGLPVAQLIQLRQQGLTGEYIGALQALGYTELSLGRWLALRQHGVSADDVRALAAVGYPGLSVTMLLAIKKHGVTADYVRELRDVGYKDLPVAQLLEWRARGLTAERLPARRQKPKAFDLDGLLQLPWLRNEPEPEC